MDKEKFQKQLVQLISHQHKIHLMTRSYSLFLREGGTIGSDELIELFDLLHHHSGEEGKLLFDLAKEEGLTKPQQSQLRNETKDEQSLRHPKMITKPESRLYWKGLS
jgi:hypothetical protein